MISIKEGVVQAYHNMIKECYKHDRCKDCNMFDIKNINNCVNIRREYKKIKEDNNEC